MKWYSQFLTKTWLIFVALCCTTLYLGCADEAVLPQVIEYPSLTYAPMHVGDEWKYYSTKERDTLLIWIDGATLLDKAVYYNVRSAWVKSSLGLTSRYIRSDGTGKMFEWKDKNERLIFDFTRDTLGSNELNVEVRNGTTDSVKTISGLYVKTNTTKSNIVNGVESFTANYAERVGLVRRIVENNGIVLTRDTLLLSYAYVNKVDYGTK